MTIKGYQEVILDNIEEGEILEFWLLKLRSEANVPHDAFIVSFNDLLRTRVLEYYPDGKVYRDYGKEVENDD